MMKATYTDSRTAQDRLAQVADHLSGAKQAGKQALLQKHPDDVREDPSFRHSAFPISYKDVAAYSIATSTLMTLYMHARCNVD